MTRTHNTDKRETRKKCLISIVIGIIVFTAFASSLSNEFVYDDKTFIINNETIKSLNPVSKFFLSPKAYSAKGTFVIYRPLPALSFAVDYAAWGLEPFCFRLTNILVHSACALLVYFLTLIITRQRLLSIFSALFFGLHPAHTEAVIWIGARSNPLFLFFLLGSLMLYILDRNQSPERFAGRFYWLSLLAFALALFSKEAAIVLPALVIAYESVYGKDLFLKGSKRRLSHAIARLCPFLLCMLFYVLLRHAVLGKTAQIARWGGGVLPTVYTMVQVVGEYILLFLWPASLCLKRFHTVTFNLNAAVFLVALFHGATIYGAWKLRKARPLISFGIVWFYLSLLPVANIIPIKSLFNDRFLYLPSIGLIWVAASLMWDESAWSLCRKRGPRVTLVLSTVICIALATRTFYRNEDWRNSFTLWSQTVKVSPRSPEANLNLGNIYQKQGDYQKAERYIKRAVKYTVNRRNGDAYFSYGNLLFYHLKKFKEAKRAYEEAVAREPSLYQAYGNLGLVCLVLGEVDQAERQFKKVLEIHPGDTLAEEQLAIAQEMRNGTVAGIFFDNENIRFIITPEKSE